MKRKLILFILISALAVISLLPGATAYAADQLCISQIKIEAGNDAAEKLESGGYTVIYQNLNPSGKDRIYLGYKLGKTPITGLIVSSVSGSTVSVNSVSYKPVSSLNLNQGTKGSPVYLYSTTDPKAGSGIISLSFVKDIKDGSVNLLDKFGDGSVPVRTADGGAADFDEGIAGRDLYLFTVHENSCKPYISDIKAVNVGREENAFKKIVASGCDYFNTEPAAKADGTSTYLCFKRTADASQAVRFAAVSDGPQTDGITYQSAGSFILNGENVNLYYTKDETVGNPVSEITKGSLSKADFTLGDWAKSYFSKADSSAISSICGEDLYNSLIESEEKYTQLKIKDETNGSDTGLYMILSAAGIEADESEESAVVLASEQSGKTMQMQRDTEITGIEKDEAVSDTEKAETAANVSASAISSGSIIFIAAVIIAAAAAAAATVILKKRKKNKK